MEVRLLGRVTDVKELFIKAKIPMDVRLFGRVIEVRELF